MKSIITFHGRPIINSGNSAMALQMSEGKYRPAKMTTRSWQMILRSLSLFVPLSIFSISCCTFFLLTFDCCYLWLPSPSVHSITLGPYQTHILSFTVCSIRVFVIWLWNALDVLEERTPGRIPPNLLIVSAVHKHIYQCSVNTCDPILFHGSTFHCTSFTIHHPIRHSHVYLVFW